MHFSTVTLQNWCHNLKQETVQCYIDMTKHFDLFDLVSEQWHKTFHSDVTDMFVDINSGGFWHGWTGQPWHVGGSTSTWKKIICVAKRFSIIYHITVWGIGKLAPLLAEKVPCTEAVRSGKRRGCGRWGQFTSPKWSGQGGGGGIHLMG